MCPCHQPEENSAGTNWPFALRILSESHLRRQWWKHAAPIVERSWECPQVVPKGHILRLNFRRDNELIFKWVDSTVSCWGIILPIQEFDCTWKVRLNENFDNVLRTWFLYDTGDVSGWLDSKFFLVTSVGYQCISLNDRWTITDIRQQYPKRLSVATLIYQIIY